MNMFKKFIKKCHVYLLIFGLISAAFFIPFDLVISDERAFQVVDEYGIPLKNCIVEHDWIQYALEFRDSETRVTDDNGFVFLPKRTIRTSWAELIRASYVKLQLYGIHSSFNSDDVVALSASGYKTEIIYSRYWRGNKIILKKELPL